MEIVPAMNLQVSSVPESTTLAVGDRIVMPAKVATKLQQLRKIQILVDRAKTGNRNISCQKTYDAESADNVIMYFLPYPVQKVSAGITLGRT